MCSSGGGILDILQHVDTYADRYGLITTLRPPAGRPRPTDPPDAYTYTRDGNGARAAFDSRACARAGSSLASVGRQPPGPTTHAAD